MNLKKTNLELVRNIETSTTIVQAFKTNINIFYNSDANIVNEDLFIIVSINKKTKKEYVRFGNEVQMISIINTYKNYDKEFTLV